MADRKLVALGLYTTREDREYGLHWEMTYSSGSGMRSASDIRRACLQ
jgi:hypothetical protein